jgi:four helix bundle protein
MGTYKRFEDLPVWQHSRQFAAKAEQVIENSGIRKSFKLRDQMLGSSGSIMDNIAEGFERNGNKEFMNFLYYSKGSAGEFRSQLYRALDANRINESDFDELYAQVEAISKELQLFLNHLHNSELRGVKYTSRGNI